MKEIILYRDKLKEHIKEYFSDSSQVIESSTAIGKTNLANFALNHFSDEDLGFSSGSFLMKKGELDTAKTNRKFIVSRDDDGFHFKISPEYDIDFSVNINPTSKNGSASFLHLDNNDWYDCNISPSFQSEVLDEKRDVLENVDIEAAIIAIDINEQNLVLTPTYEEFLDIISNDEELRNLVITQLQKANEIICRDHYEYFNSSHIHYSFTPSFHEEHEYYDLITTIKKTKEFKSNKPNSFNRADNSSKNLFYEFIRTSRIYTN